MHAHSKWTRATVHGAIVVLPAAGTVYPFPKPDEEEVIVLGMSHVSYKFFYTFSPRILWLKSLSFIQR